MKPEILPVASVEVPHISEKVKKHGWRPKGSRGRPESPLVASAEAKPSATRKINYMIKTINIKKSKR